MSLRLAALVSVFMRNHGECVGSFEIGRRYRVDDRWGFVGVPDGEVDQDGAFAIGRLPP